MVKAYKYFVYQLFIWYSSMDNIPSTTVNCTISSVMLLNIATIINLLDFLKILNISSIIGFFYLTVSLILLTLNGYLILKKLNIETNTRRLNQIESFKGDINNLNNKITQIVVGYISVSFLMFLISLSLL